jgi:hypothetical protein
MRPVLRGIAPKTLLEIRTAPASVGAARKSWRCTEKRRERRTRGCSDALSLDYDPTSPSMQGFMRTGQTSRPYGRYNGNNANRNRQQVPHRSQNFESNGPNIKIRGTPHQIFERYISLAREASTSGDRVASENLYQHAEHYFRVMNAANEGHQHRATRPTAADLQTEMSQEEGSEMVGPSRASPSDRQSYSS